MTLHIRDIEDMPGLSRLTGTAIEPLASCPYRCRGCPITEKKDETRADEDAFFVRFIGGAGEIPERISGRKGGSVLSWFGPAVDLPEGGLDAIISFGIDEIGLAILSFEERRHDEISGVPGSFQATIRAIRDSNRDAGIVIAAPGMAYREAAHVMRLGWEFGIDVLFSVSEVPCRAMRRSQREDT